jgi:hypothetical protein
VAYQLLDQSTPYSRGQRRSAREAHPRHPSAPPASNRNRQSQSHHRLAAALRRHLLPRDARFPIPESSFIPFAPRKTSPSAVSDRRLEYALAVCLEHPAHSYLTCPTTTTSQPSWLINPPRNAVANLWLVLCRVPYRTSTCYELHIPVPLPSPDPARLLLAPGPWLPQHPPEAQGRRRRRSKQQRRQQSQQ